jgi:hypothetical protein
MHGGFRDGHPTIAVAANADRAVHALYAQTQLLANRGPRGQSRSGNPANTEGPAMRTNRRRLERRTTRDQTHNHVSEPNNTSGLLAAC